MVSFLWPVVVMRDSGAESGVMSVDLEIDGAPSFSGLLLPNLILNITRTAEYFGYKNL